MLFSDFHTELNSITSQGLTFPSECTTSGMTAEEKMVEYMISTSTICVAP